MCGKYHLFRIRPNISDNIGVYASQASFSLRMSDQTHPAKRLRRDEDTGAANPTQTTDNFDHDAELWFEDGNIVLVSAGGVAFRVYRGLLAAQSTVFADMLASSSSREDETVDGSPTVRLSDSPEDLRHFLRVLFPKTRRLYVNRCRCPHRIQSISLACTASTVMTTNHTLLSTKCLR